MKRIITGTLVSMLVLSVAAGVLSGCGKTPEPENPTGGTEVVETTSVTSASAVKNTEADKAFRTLLEDIIVNPIDYFEIPGPDQESDVVYQFATGDIDGDGTDELIVHFVSTVEAAAKKSVWKYNDAAGKAEKLNMDFGMLTDFYKNGNVRAELTFNQGFGDTIRPFRICTVKDGTVEDLYSFYCVDSKYEDAYKAEDDKDNDGVIYYCEDVAAGNSGENAAAMTKAGFDSLVSRYVPDSQKVDLNFIDLTEENISGLK